MNSSLPLKFGHLITTEFLILLMALFVILMVIIIIMTDDDDDDDDERVVALTMINLKIRKSLKSTNSFKHNMNRPLY